MKRYLFLPMLSTKEDKTARKSARLSQTEMFPFGSRFFNPEVEPLRRSLVRLRPHPVARRQAETVTKT